MLYLRQGYTDTEGEQWEMPSEFANLYEVAGAVLTLSPELWEVKDAQGKDRTDETAIVLSHLRRAYRDISALAGKPRDMQARRFAMEKGEMRLR